MSAKARRPQSSASSSAPAAVQPAPVLDPQQTVGNAALMESAPGLEGASATAGEQGRSLLSDLVNKVTGGVSVNSVKHFDSLVSADVKAKKLNPAIVHCYTKEDLYKSLSSGTLSFAYAQLHKLQAIKDDKKAKKLERGKSLASGCAKKIGFELDVSGFFAAPKAGCETLGTLSKMKCLNGEKGFWSE
jgi:hypothetical protein